ncbi:MAG: acyl-CoA thioesterase, partial [Microbacterium sp.]
MTDPSTGSATAGAHSATARPRLHIPIQLRWGDLDAFNHVNNTAMLKLLEEARVRAFWLPEPGEDAPDTAVLDSSIFSGVLTLIARQEIEYLAPVPY